MEPVPVSCVVTALADWPDDHVRRAHRLTVLAWRNLAENDGGDDVAALQAEAERFGLELVRRGLW